MSQYSAADIVGKSLIAKTTVPLKRIPSDNAPVIYTVAPGQGVGVVHSWIDPSPNNKRLYWAFKDNTGKSYYAEHLEGRFSIGALTNQGVQTTAEKEEEKARENEGFLGWLERNVKTVGIIAAAAVIGKALINRNGSK